MQCERRVSNIEVKVCLAHKIGDQWDRMGCRVNVKRDDNNAPRRIKERCIWQNNETYRVRVRAYASDPGTVFVQDDKEVDKQSRTFYCQGGIPTPAEGTEYVDDLVYPEDSP